MPDTLNLRDNGFNVIVGQRQGKTYDKAVEDGWVPGETLFGIEEACDKATIIMCLLSDAAVMSVWPTMKPYLTAGKALYFSHGFAITWNDRTGVVPPADIDVIMVAPKGISESTGKKDYSTKLNKYWSAGVREYWIVDPLKGRVLTYCFNGDNPDIGIYGLHDTVPVGIYGDLSIDFGEFFFLV